MKETYNSKVYRVVDRDLNAASAALAELRDAGCNTALDLRRRPGPFARGSPDAASRIPRSLPRDPASLYDW